MENPVTRNGFTLIELLVVISVISLMASVVIVGMNGIRSKGNDTKRVADMQQVAKALEICQLEYGSYPPNDSGRSNAFAPGNILCASQSAKICFFGNSCGTNGRQIMVMPKTPLPVNNPPGATTCSSRPNQYTYDSATSSATYTLTFCISDQIGNLAPGLHTITSRGIQ